jgi:hypothetical protein
MIIFMEQHLVYLAYLHLIGLSFYGSIKRMLSNIIIKVSQNEQNEKGNVDILAKEIGSWKDFRYVLREENALIFNEMPSGCGQNKDYIRAVISKDKNHL